MDAYVLFFVYSYLFIVSFGLMKAKDFSLWAEPDHKGGSGVLTPPQEEKIIPKNKKEQI